MNTKNGMTNIEIKNFELGESFMLFNLKKRLEGASDSIQIATRVQNFIREEEDNARKSRKHNT